MEDRDQVVGKYTYEIEPLYFIGVFTLFILAGGDDRELVYTLWNVTHAVPHDHIAADFVYGFRGDMEERFRWIKKGIGHIPIFHLSILVFKLMLIRSVFLGLTFLTDPTGVVVPRVDRPDYIPKSHGSERVMVPLDPKDYLGPPAAWPEHEGGEAIV